MEERFAAILLMAGEGRRLGSPIPKFYGGLDLTASYKGFDFNAYFYGVYGNKLLNYEKSNLQSFFICFLLYDNNA